MRITAKLSFTQCPITIICIAQTRGKWLAKYHVTNGKHFTICTKIHIIWLTENVIENVEKINLAQSWQHAINNNARSTMMLNCWMMQLLTITSMNFMLMQTTWMEITHIHLSRMFLYQKIENSHQLQCIHQHFLHDMFENLPATWINTYNELLAFVKTFYEIDVDVVRYTMFSRDKMLKNWDFYEWLNVQINSSNESILKVMEMFFRDGKNRLFVVGFFHSDFVDENECKIYNCLDEMSKTYLNLSLSHTSSRRNKEKRVWRRERFMERLKKILDFIREYKQKYDDYPDKIRWETRKPIYGQFSQFNLSFKMCCGVLQYGFERKLWVQFNKMKYVDDFYRNCYCGKIDNPLTQKTSHARKTVGSLLKKSFIEPKIKSLKTMMSSDDVDKLKRANVQFCYYNSQYDKYIGKMTCNTTRELWKRFITDDIELIQKCFVANGRAFRKFVTKSEVCEKKEKEDLMEKSDERTYTDEEFREFVIETFL